jgi:hypothetical protein
MGQFEGATNGGWLGRHSHVGSLLLRAGLFVGLFPFMWIQLAALHRLDEAVAVQQMMSHQETALRKRKALRKNVPSALQQTMAARQAAASIPLVIGYEYNETWNAADGAAAATRRNMTLDRALVVPSASGWLLDNPPSSRNQTSVPKVIYKAFLSNRGILPDFRNQSSQLRDAHDSWIRKNPGYELRYFDLITIRQYLGRYFHPVFLRAFDCIEAYAGKNNFFRAAVLYREGGWYSDWKEVCLEDDLLDTLSSNNRTLVVPWDQGTAHSRKNQCVMNGFFGATERHPGKQAGWFARIVSHLCCRACVVRSAGRISETSVTERAKVALWRNTAVQYRPLRSRPGVQKSCGERRPCGPTIDTNLQIPMELLLL